MNIHSSFISAIPFRGKAEFSDDGSLQPVTLHAKIRKMPDDDLKLFINWGDPNDPAQDVPYSVKAPMNYAMERDNIAHDLLDHVLLSPSFCPLPNAGGELIHGSGGGWVNVEQRVPKGGLDYVALVKRLTHGMMSYNPNFMDLSELLQFFWKGSTLGEELILSFIIPPPDRSYDYPKKPMLQPFQVGSDLKGEKVLLAQIEKDHLNYNERQQLLNALKEGKSFQSFVFPQLEKGRILSYRINPKSDSYHLRRITRFYPVGEKEEYTGYPYESIELKEIILKGKLRGKRPKGRRQSSKLIRGLKLFFNQLEKRKEALLKSSDLLEGRPLVTLNDTYYQLLQGKLETFSKSQRALLKKLKFKEDKLKEGIWEVNDVQASFKHFFENTEWSDPAKDHYPKGCQPQFIPVAPPLKAKE